MRIKTRLTLSVGILFALILLLAVISVGYVYTLKTDTTNILKANYKTLEYGHSMLQLIDGLPTDTFSQQRFASYLDKQLKNITEPGEKEATYLLEKHFAQLMAGPTQDSLQPLVRQDLIHIIQLNLNAIRHKSDKAQKTAQSALFWIALSGGLCLAIALGLLLSVPAQIANPIAKLTASIRQIADKNYNQRLSFVGYSEFVTLAHSFNVMAEKLEEFNNSNLSGLLFEKKRIETLINNWTDPVIGLDGQQKIIFANEQALNVLGLKTAQVLGKDATAMAADNDLFRTLLAGMHLPSTDREQPLKIYVDNKESYFQQEVISIDIKPTGEPLPINIGHVIILKNITPFKELDFAKTNFMATVSHELKTPIAAIKLSLQLLENPHTGPLNEAQQQLIDSIKDDSNRLLKITGELLDMSQVETGNIQLKVQKSDPLQIAQYALSAVRVQATQQQLELVLQTPDHLPDIKADSEKTAWVLINLLTNAIRYSPEKAKVYIRIYPEHAHVCFSVKDEGQGIDARYLDKIFDKYFQAPNSQKSGTGLGLAISKEFIDAQSGSIGVESELGLGSTFFFKLPQA